MKKFIIFVVFVAALVLIVKGVLEDLSAKDNVQEDPVVKTVQQIDRARMAVTGVDSHHIQTQITAFILTMGRRPKSLQEMVDHNYLTYQHTIDPWNIRYKEEWTEKELILKSNGEDHVANTPDDQIHRIPIGG